MARGQGGGIDGGDTDVKCEIKAIHVQTWEIWNYCANCIIVTRIRT